MSPSEIMPGLSLTNIDAMSLYDNLRDAKNSTELQGESQISKTAEDFEGVFLSLLIKEMRGTLQQGGLFGEEGSDTFGGMFDLFMGQHLAKSAPLGIPEIVKNSYAELQNGGDQETISVKA